MTSPTGTVTFLFTDIEGSTKLWEAHPEQMQQALARHDAILRQAIEQGGGSVFKTVGDAFCAAFATALDALTVSLNAQFALSKEIWPAEIQVRVRMALHTGAVESRDNDYFGQPLSRVARLLAAGHGGQTILSQVTYDLVRDSLPLLTTIKDLGEHRLKDLARPEQVFQVAHSRLPNDFPPLKSLDSAVLPNNLPEQVTRFIGREKELVEVRERLAKTRLLTLTGAGGSGKSRLSLQAAADLLDKYPDGAWLVELAPLADPDLVASATASVLRVKAEPDKPILATLTTALKEKRLLLLLDNCEHVLDASANLADALIRSCPGVKILATSREGLSIAGEATYRVPSLSLPDPRSSQTADSLTHFEAVRLFTDRAIQTQPNFVVTDENASALASICLRLDGIPLAIELAAARARSLSVEDINSKLDQRFRLLTGGSRTALPRQQTLRSLIDWSYDLLSEAEKALLQRLSIFAGGWTLEAAEAICVGGEVEDWEILDNLTALCDKSLVVAEPSGTSTRYRLLETIRQYSRDRLLESGEGEIYRDNHLDFFLALAEEMDPMIGKPQMKAALDRLEEEIDNLRAALEWSGSSPERVESYLRLALKMGPLWWRGHIANGQEMERVSRAVELSEGVNPSLRAKVLYHLARGESHRGDFAKERRLLDESLAIRQELDDRRGTAETLNGLGSLASNQKDYALARQRFEESLVILRELGDQVGIAGALNDIGVITYYQDDLTATRRFYEESLKIHREHGAPYSVCVSLLNIGEVLLKMKDYHAARAAWRECLAIVTENSIKAFIPWVMKAIAGIFAATGSPLDAARLWGLAERLFNESGETLSIHVRERNDAQVAAARAALADDAAFDGAWQEGRKLTLEQAAALALKETKEADKAVYFAPAPDGPNN